MKIEVNRFYSHEFGVMKGVFDMTVNTSETGDMKFFGCTFYDKGGSCWINFPSREIKKGGEKSYEPCIRFQDKEIYDKMVSLAVVAVKNYIKEKPVEDKKTKGVFDWAQ